MYQLFPFDADAHTVAHPHANFIFYELSISEHRLRCWTIYKMECGVTAWRETHLYHELSSTSISCYETRTVYTVNRYRCISRGASNLKRQFQLTFETQVPKINVFSCFSFISMCTCFILHLKQTKIIFLTWGFSNLKVFKTVYIKKKKKWMYKIVNSFPRVSV